VSRIVGGIVGGVIALVTIVSLVVLVYIRRRRFGQKQQQGGDFTEPQEMAAEDMKEFPVDSVYEMNGEKELQPPSELPGFGLDRPRTPIELPSYEKSVKGE
jgi:hypothetical protein